MSCNPGFDWVAQNVVKEKWPCACFGVLSPGGFPPVLEVLSWKLMGLSTVPEVSCGLDPLRQEPVCRNQRLAYPVDKWVWHHLLKDRLLSPCRQWIICCLAFLLWYRRAWVWGWGILHSVNQLFCMASMFLNCWNKSCGFLSTPLLFSTTYTLVTLSPGIRSPSVSPPHSLSAAWWISGGKLPLKVFLSNVPW